MNIDYHELVKIRLVKHSLWGLVIVHRLLSTPWQMVTIASHFVDYPYLQTEMLIKSS